MTDCTIFHLGSDAYWADVAFLAEHEDEFGPEWAFRRTLQLAETYAFGDVQAMISWTKEQYV